MPSNQEISFSEAEELLYKVREIKNSLLIKSRRVIDDDEVLSKLDELLSEEKTQGLRQDNVSDIRNQIIEELMTCSGRLAYHHAKSLCSTMLLLAWGNEKEIKEIKRFREELMLKRGRLLELIIPENNWLYTLEAKLRSIKLPRFLRNTFLSRIKVSSNPNTLDLITTLSYLSFVVIIVVVAYNINHWNDPPEIKMQVQRQDIEVYDSKNNITYYYDKSKYDSIKKSLDSTTSDLKIVKTPYDSIIKSEAVKKIVDSITKSLSH